ncbi:disks large homolog 2-like [Thrips palmi]|uniref:Disks large homolog 2-like n=1 Tax=Thrips palmi TaxID=161013 RepID=A0A6P8YCX6_THRPL|nr:disks large homolog 2-like [Thrips palmi]
MVPVASSERLPMRTRTPSVGDDLGDDDLEDEEVAAVWGSDVLQLPTSLEIDIRIRKGSLPLGLSVDSVGRGVNGMLVVAVVPGGAAYRDGRMVPGDLVVSVNNESLRHVTNAQARAILKRANLVSTHLNVVYIPGEAAAAYRRSLAEVPTVTPPPKHSKQPSPRIFPEYYRSPYIHEGGPDARTRSASESSGDLLEEPPEPPAPDEDPEPPPPPDEPPGPSPLPPPPEELLAEAESLPESEPEYPTAPLKPTSTPLYAHVVGKEFQLSSEESLNEELLRLRDDICPAVGQTELPSVGTSPAERSPVLRVPRRRHLAVARRARRPRPR